MLVDTAPAGVDIQSIPVANRRAPVSRIRPHPTSSSSAIALTLR